MEREKCMMASGCSRYAFALSHSPFMPVFARQCSAMTGPLQAHYCGYASVTAPPVSATVAVATARPRGVATVTV